MAKMDKEQITRTPANEGKGDLGVVVDNLGKSVKSYEELFAKSIATALFGQKGANASNVGDLKNVVGQKSVVDIISNTQKSVESIAKSLNNQKTLSTFNYVQKISSILFTELYTLISKNTGIPVNIVALPQEKGGTSKKSSDVNQQTLNVILEGNDFAQILTELEALSDNSTLSSLKDIFQMIIDSSKNLSSASDNMMNLSTAIDTLSSVNDINTSKFQLLVEQLNNLGSVSISPTDIKDSFTGIASLVTEIGKMDVDPSILNVEKIDTLMSVISQIEFPEGVNNETLEKLDNSFFGEIGIVNFLNQIGNINFDTKGLEKMSKNINELISLTTEIDKIQIHKGIEDDLISTGNAISKINEILDSVKLKKQILFNIKSDFLHDNILAIQNLINNDIATIKASKSLLNNMDNVIKLIKQVGGINIKESTKELRELEDKIWSLHCISDGLQNFVENVNKIKSPKGLKDTQVIIGLVQSISEIANEISNHKELSDNELLDRLVSIDNIVKNLYLIVESVNESNISKLSINDADWDKVNSLVKNVTSISTYIEKFVPGAEEKLEKMQSFIIKLADGKDSFIQKVIDLQTPDAKEIDNKFDGYKNIIKNVAIIGLISAMFIPIAPIALVGLGLMIPLMMMLDFVLKRMSDNSIKVIEGAMANAEKLGKFVMLCGFTMLIGGIIITMFPEVIKGSFMFGFMLGAFILSVLTPFWLYSKKLEKTLPDAENLGKFVAMCGAVMLIGGIIMTLFPQLIIGSFLFAFALGAFILVILGAVGLGTRALKDGAKADLEGIGEFVAACGLILILGGLIMMFAPQVVMASFVFALALGLFIFLVIKAINVGSSWLTEGGSKALKEVRNLVILSSLLLILGGALVLFFPKIILAGMLFGLALGGFIWLITKAYTSNAKEIQQGQVLGWQFIVLTALSAGILLIAGKLVSDNPGILLGAIAFGAALGGFIWLMGKVSETLSKNQGITWKAVGIMAALEIIVLGGALMMSKLGELDKNYKLTDILLAAGTFALIIGGLALMCRVIGDPNIVLYVAAGAAVMAGIAAVVLMGAHALKLVGESMQIFAEIKPIPTKDILTNILGFMGIIAALTPLANPFIAFIILGASATVASLSIAISKISQAVEEAASMNVPIYEGTKIVGYRKLKQSDFKDAANNVKLVIKTLGGAIIDIYKECPEIFSTGSWLGDFFGGETIFSKVTKSVANLGFAISKISSGVKDYASLKVPIYEGTKVVGYRSLSNSDFNSAAKNVKKVVLTLGGAMIDLYEKNPQMFKDTSLFSFLTGGSASNTPLSKVISVTSKLGKVISNIASGVQNYASMKYADQWDPKTGKPIHFEHVKPEQVVEAGNNVKTVILTLSRALMELYKENPQMFQDKSIFSVFGGSASNTPLGMVIGVTSKIGSLISNIAYGVQNWANMKIPIDWDKNGKPIKFNEFSDEDKIKAANNIKSVISILSQSLIDLYNGNQQMYTDDSWWHTDSSKTPLGMVIGVTSKIGSIVSNIAFGVQNWANMKVPNKWDKDGKPTNFILIKEQDKLNAVENIKTTITTLSQALIDLYNENPQMYTDDSWWHTDSSKTPLGMVVGVTSKISKIVSNIASGVSSMAQSKIPIDWDKNGKPIKFENLSDKHFELAATGVANIVTCLGNSIIDIVKQKPEWFNDDEDSIFAIATSSCESLGTLVANLAQGIKGYAELQIPDAWDENGKVIKYRKLTETDFNEAGSNIGKVIGTLANSIIATASAHPDWFEDGEDSEFKGIMDSISGMGTLISGLSQGISKIAVLQIPDQWNDKGEPIHYITLDKNVFEDAGSSIGEIIGTIGNSLISFYNSNTHLFESEDGKDTIFMRVANSCASMSEMISNVAEGVQFYATIYSQKLPNGKTITPQTFTDAGTNISTILTTLGTTIKSVYDNNSTLFDIPNLGTKKDGTIQTGDTPFIRVVNGCNAMGEMIMNIADGIQTYAEIDKKIAWEAAAINISKIVTHLGNSIIGLYDTNEEIFNTGFGQKETKFTKIVKSFNDIGKMIGSMVEGISLVSNLQYATEWDDKTGKAIKFKNFDETGFTNAQNNIKSIMTTVAKSVSESLNDEDVKKILYNSQAKILVTRINETVQSISSIATYIQQLSSLKIPSEFDKDGNILGYIKLEEPHFTAASNSIKTIITTISEGLNTALTDKSIPDEDDVEDMINNIVFAVNQVSSIGHQLKNFADGKFSYLDENGKNVEITLGKEDYAAAGNNITTIITTIASALSAGAKSMFEDNDAGFAWFDSNSNQTSRIVKMLNIIPIAVQKVAGIADLLNQIAGGNIKIKDENGVELNKSNWEIAGENIKIILGTVAEAVGTAATAMFEGNNAGFAWFDDDSNQTSRIAIMFKATEIAINKVAGIAKKINFIANGTINGTKITNQMFIDAGKNIKTILTAISNAVGEASDELFGGISLDSDTETATNIGVMFNSIEKTIKLLNDLTLIINGYSSGQDIKVTIGDKSYNLMHVSSEKITAAKTNIESIINGIVSIISNASDTFEGNSVSSNFDSIVNSIDNLFLVISRTNNLISKITALNLGLESVKNIDISTALNPIFTQLQETYTKLNSLESSSSSMVRGLFGGGLFNENPIDKLLNTTKKLNEITSSSASININPLGESIKQVNADLSEVQDPTNFTNMTTSLDTYVKSINSIKVENVSALTGLVKELSKLNLDMNGLTQLSKAISKDLSTTLQLVSKALKETNNTLKAESKRKDERNKEIKSSVNEIRSLMNNTVNVVVHNDNSSNPSGTTPGPDSIKTTEESTESPTKPPNGTPTVKQN